MNTVQYVTLLGVGIANLAAMGAAIKIALDAKRSGEQEVEALRKKTNRTISKFAAALEDLEV
jgi:DNA-binding transcriptional regulator YiaG